MWRIATEFLWYDNSELDRKQMWEHDGGPLAVLTARFVYLCLHLALFVYTVKPACRLPVDVGSCQCVQVVPWAPRSNPLVDYLPLQYPAPYNHGQSWHYVLLFPEGYKHKEIPKIPGTSTRCLGVHTGDVVQGLTRLTGIRGTTEARVCLSSWTAPAISSRSSLCLSRSARI